MSPNPPGNFRSIENVRAELGGGASVEIIVGIGKGLPHYCIYCASPCERVIVVPVTGGDSRAARERKVVKRIWAFALFGKFFGTLAALLSSRDELENTGDSHKKTVLPVCTRCQQEKGLPRAEIAGLDARIWCCEAFAEKLSRGDYGGVDPY